MEKTKRTILFTTIAIVTGLVLQCTPNLVEDVLDSGITDSSIFDSDIFDSISNDAQADIDIPANCQCSEPLTELDQRLIAIEERISALIELENRISTLEEQSTVTPENNTFSMRVGYNNDTLHNLVTPGSYIFASQQLSHIDANGNFIWNNNITMMAYDSANRSAISINFTIPETISINSTIELNDSTLSTVSISISDTSEEPSVMSCSVIHSYWSNVGTISGNITITRRDSRITGIFNGTFTGNDGCIVNVENGSFDANIIPHSDGEYVAP